MNSTEPASCPPHRMEDAPSPPAHSTEVKRKEGTLTRFVDPYELRTEPQPEEPGYGHGV